MIINPYRFAAAGGFEDFGNASRAFNGTTDYLLTVDNSRGAFNYIHEDKVFTIAAWIKLDDHTAEGIQVITANANISSLDKGFTAWYDNRTGVREKGFVVYISNGISGQVDFLAQANVISDNDWHHVCWTGDGSDITFYLDGIADVTTEPVTYTGVYGNASQYLFVGQIASANYFDGKIADLRIYDEDIGVTAAGNLSNGIDVATGLQHWIIKDADSVEDYALGDNPAAFYNMRNDTGTTYDTNGPAD